MESHILMLTFRPMTLDDIPLFHRWRNHKHVSDWWQPPYPSYADVDEEIRAYLRPKFGVAAYIVLDDATPFGYVQRWTVAEFPDYDPFVTLTPEVVGVDVFIGEPDYLHKGWGTRLMVGFLRDYVFNDPNVPSCIIDPLPNNAAAIRAYDKVGFYHEADFVYDGTDVYFMRITRGRFFAKWGHQPAPTDNTT
ncbi:MAG: GNAT family N-acetyltransferase [Phototrophicaceae bacterium]|jgi:RimJ/RimL family protein N-acetyltransferase